MFKINCDKFLLAFAKSEMTLRYIGVLQSNINESIKRLKY